MKKTSILFALLLTFLFSSQASALYVDISVANGDPMPAFFYFDANNDGVLSGNPYNYDPTVGDTEANDSALVAQFIVDVYTDESKSVLEFSTFGFCIDLTTESGDGSAVLSDFSNLNNAELVALLLDTYWDEDNSAYENAALQMAIWSLIYGSGSYQDPIFDGFGLSLYALSDQSGSLYEGTKVSDTDFLAVRENYLEYIAFIENNQNGVGNVQNYSLIDFSNGSTQNLLIRNVPEPATLLLLGTGLIGMAGAASRRKWFKRS